ncbi:MAG: DUF2510 domain-containing protein [Actinobacteria bacterium]|nr:DUF2510 domain-containing protein [Actinomycetota bacterium]MCG2801054.1 DUF2510 domain-containing protein [Cellulomonas sp.]
MDSLPVAGWYDDGATPGSLRWFDGSTCTETTRPIAPPAPVPATFSAPPSTFGSLPTGRLGQSLNLADHVSEGAQYRRNRLDDALTLRRRGFTQFGGALVVLLVTGAIGIAMHGADTIWYVGVAAAVFLGIRAWRDYRNATFRGAPELTASAWVLAGAALVVAIAVLVTGPIVAMTTLAHHLGTLGH